MAVGGPGFSRGATTPNEAVVTSFLAFLFAENCMKVKEFGLEHTFTAPRLGSATGLS